MMAEKAVIASVGRRIFGGLIDLFFSFIFALFFGYLTGLGTKPAYGYGMNIKGWSFLLALFICFLLFALMEYTTGKTLGKYLAKTKVVTENFSKISIWQALIRNLVRYIDGIAFYLFGLITIICTKDHQRLGDLLAKTYVVKD